MGGARYAPDQEGCQAGCLCSLLVTRGHYKAKALEGWITKLTLDTRGSHECCLGKTVVFRDRRQAVVSNQGFVRRSGAWPALTIDPAWFILHSRVHGCTAPTCRSLTAGQAPSSAACGGIRVTTYPGGGGGGGIGTMMCPAFRDDFTFRLRGRAGWMPNPPSRGSSPS